jgi:hypothetical protein
MQEPGQELLHDEVDEKEPGQRERGVERACEEVFPEPLDCARLIAGGGAGGSIVSRTKGTVWA